LEILGYIAAIFIGISLGLIGSGGSILTVPVLVYIMMIDPVDATAYSLFIVGITSMVGAVNYFRKGLVNFKAAAVFSIPALIAVFITRFYILPSIPKELFSIGDWTLTKPIFIMLLFAILMLLAAISMLRENKVEIKDCDEINYNFLHITLEGIAVGVLTGLVGAGGGCLIIPALVLFTKVPMKMAVGTSLVIIAIKSLIGFTGDLGGYTEIKWSVLFGFSALAIFGIFIGGYLSKYLSNEKLKPTFGWFVLIMAIYIIIKELVKNNLI